MYIINAQRTKHMNKTDLIVSAKDFSHRPAWFNILNTAWEKFYAFGTRPRLDKDEMMLTAKRLTGLHDFGKDFWDEPLEKLIYSLENEARLHAIGYFISRKRIINLLMVRLRAEEYFKKYPEILDIEIHSPIVIVGLQRTGTTKLHRLLNADQENRVLKSWEAINPVPFQNPREKRADGRPDKRIKTAKTTEKALRKMAPGFFAIHPVEYDAPEEDILLLDTTFLSTTPEATTHVPSYAAWLEQTDQSAAYSYTAKLMKLLQCQDPARRWVCKSPHHLEFLPLIRKYMGEAHFIWTHRNPMECIPSFLSMVSYSRAIFSNDVRIDEVRDHWVSKTTYMLNKGLEFRTAGNNESFFTDILYDLLVKDPMGQLEKIYERHGGISDELRQQFLLMEKNNPKGKYGIHEYSYQDFNLEKEDLARRNTNYCRLYSMLLENSSIPASYAC